MRHIVGTLQNARLAQLKVALFFAAAVLVLLLGTTSTLKLIQEEILFAFDPSAARAYAYGTAHFDAMERGMYDIDRAERFFKAAYEIDPVHPYVNHQLARIAFLRGDFSTAIYYINREVELNPNPSPSSYYVRGLIKGFAGEYDSAAKDYERYLDSDPSNWAAINDLAWVLLKARRFAEAESVTSDALEMIPDNPWLLNSYAIALSEQGEYLEALPIARRAADLVTSVTESDWLRAYPGNDPAIAKEGVVAFRRAVVENMHTIEAHAATMAVQ